MDSCQETETRSGGENGEGAVVFAEGVELDQETATINFKDKFKIRVSNCGFMFKKIQNSSY